MTVTISRTGRLIGRTLAYAWASPYTLVGVLLGLIGVCSGGRVRQVAGVLEFSGGAFGRAVARLPDGRKFCAITFGHTILGVCEDTLCAVRVHEQVHVRQYERWGVFFIPAYLLAGLWQGLQGRRMYADNPFECEANATIRME